MNLLRCLKNITIFSYFYYTLQGKSSVYMKRTWVLPASLAHFDNFSKFVTMASFTDSWSSNVCSSTHLSENIGSINTKSFCSSSSWEFHLFSSSSTEQSLISNEKWRHESEHTYKCVHACVRVCVCVCV